MLRDSVSLVAQAVSGFTRDPIRFRPTQQQIEAARELKEKMGGRHISQFHPSWQPTYRNALLLLEDFGGDQ